MNRTNGSGHDKKESLANAKAAVEEAAPRQQRRVDCGLLVAISDLFAGVMHVVP